MPFLTTGRNKMLDSGKASITHIGAFTDLGATEVAGGSYARQAITWTTAAAGVTDNNAQISIPIPASTTVQTLGFFDAVSAGNILGYWPVGSSGQLVQGVGIVTASSDLISSFAHGLTTDDRVFFWAANNEATPSGISVNTLYFVLAAGLTANAFAVSTTSGGAALNITTDGEIWFAKTVPNTFASAGNLVYATGALDLDLLRA